MSGERSLAELLQADYRDQLAGEPAEVELPLVNPDTGRPVVCYVFPITTAEQDRITRARGVGGIEPLVETLAQRARKRDRTRMISDPERVTLRKESMADTLAECVLRINAALPAPTKEQVGKQ